MKTIKITTNKTISIVFETTRWLLILLFVYTAVSKLLGHYLFVEQLSKVPVLQSFPAFVSIVVPLLEIAAAFTLLIIKTEMIGWWLSTILMSSFSIYVAAMILFAPVLPCSCGGIVSALNWKQHLFVNGSISLLCWMKLYHYYFISKISMHTRE